jgi:uncharacterized protein YuzE
MEQVSIRIGSVAFDHAEYDSEHDILYLHVGEPQEAEGEETPEGHVIRFVPGTKGIVGLTVMSPRFLLERDGQLSITLPETVEATADELAPALVAS